MSTEPLGRAEVEIRGDASHLNADLGKAETQAVGKVASLGKRIKRSLGEAIGPAAAIFGALGTINRVVEAWRAYSNAAADVGDENRKIQDSIAGGSGLGTALTQLEEDIQRVEKAYAAATASIASAGERKDTTDIIADKMVQGVWRVSQAWALFDAARKKDVQALARAVTDAASSEEGGYNERAKQDAADSAERQARFAAFDRERNRLSAEAHTAELSDYFKIQAEKERRIKEVHEFEKELGEEKVAQALADIEKVYKARQKKHVEAVQKEIEDERKKAEAFADAIAGAFDQVAERQRQLFDVSDLKVHMSRIGDFLAKIAQQNRRAM